MAKNNAKQLVSGYHQKVLTKGNFDLIDTYISPDIVLHNPYLPHAIKGRSKFLEFIRSVYSAFSHLKITTNDIIAEEDRVAVRWTIEGVSTNEFMNIPAGGDKRVICVMSIYHIQNNKITEAWAVDSSMWPKVHEF